MENLLVRIRDSFIHTNFIVLDMEGDLGMPLIIRRSFPRDAKERIDVRTGEIQFHIGRKNILFKFQQREEQRYLIHHDIEGQGLRAEPQPQPKEAPSTPRKIKKTKNIWHKVERTPSTTSPRWDANWKDTTEKSPTRRS